MDREQWGTLSIYDHRDPVFLRSLVFFDRTVIPVPSEPIYDISTEELDLLRADAEYLEKHEAAVVYPWDSDVFQDWQRALLREALSVGPRDNLYDTRLMLQEKLSGDAVATPVYGAREGYDDAAAGLQDYPGELLTAELAQRLSVPDAGLPLEDVVALRARRSFQSALRGLRKWRLNVVPDLANDPSDRAAKAAGRDLDRLMQRYEEELAESGVKRKEACIVSILAIGATIAGGVAGPAGALKALAVAAPAVLGIKDSMRPFWKQVRDTEFAAAGVVYEAQEVFDRYWEGSSK